MRNDLLNLRKKYTYHPVLESTELYLARKIITAFTQD